MNNKYLPMEAEAFVERMSDAQWDIEVLRHVPLKHRLNEATLYSTKWWDYRPLHPAHATALFAQAYGIAWRQASDRRFGCSSERWDLVSYPFIDRSWNPFIEAQARARGFWKARQYCDDGGMPYEFYCQQFFSKAEDYFENLPRPQEMYRRDVILPVLEDWELLSASGMPQMPKHEDYFLRYNGVDKQHQKEWEEAYSNWLDKKPGTIRNWHYLHNENYFSFEMYSLFYE